jgi:hypothetical protein
MEILARRRAVAPLEVVDACPLLELPDAVEFWLPIVCQLETGENEIPVKKKMSLFIVQLLPFLIFLSFLIFFLLVISRGQRFFSLLNLLSQKAREISRKSLFATSKRKKQ